MKMVRWINSFLILCVLFACVGCVKQKVDYVDEDTEITDTSSIQEMSTGTIKEKLGVDDNWSETVDNDKGIVIEAEIDVPDVNTVKVQGANEKVFSKEEKKRLVEMFSEETVYIYPTQYEHMTKEQLENVIEEKQSIHMWL